MSYLYAADGRRVAKMQGGAVVNDLNVRSRKKRLEKLTYMHNNPVKRGLAKEPGDWPWSSWRFYYREDASLLAIDPVA